MGIGMGFALDFGILSSSSLRFLLNLWPNYFLWFRFALCLVRYDLAHLKVEEFSR